MYNKKQNQKPLFAEVKLADDEARQQATNGDDRQSDQRVPYIKLTYPNGVTHNIPTSIDTMPVLDNERHKTVKQYVLKHIDTTPKEGLHKLLPEEWEDA